jgi:hypothetical protein
MRLEYCCKRYVLTMQRVLKRAASGKPAVHALRIVGPAEESPVARADGDQ